MNLQLRVIISPSCLDQIVALSAATAALKVILDSVT